MFVDDLCYMYYLSITYITTDDKTMINITFHYIKRENNCIQQQVKVILDASCCIQYAQLHCLIDDGFYRKYDHQLENRQKTHTTTSMRKQQLKAWRGGRVCWSFHFQALSTATKGQ